MDTWVWVWTVLAALLIIGEMLTAGFFLLPFGIGAALAAVMAFFEIAIGWQWAVFVIVSAIALASFRHFAENVTHEPPEKVGVDRVLGKPGIVITTIEAAGTGQVRIDREEWRAESVDSKRIPAGSSVVVERVVGTHVLVRPIPDEEE